jgi:hypothetical protein
MNEWIAMSGNAMSTEYQEGRALVVGQPAFRVLPMAMLQRAGVSCTEIEDPYRAMVKLCDEPLAYSALVLSLNSLYREELQIIPSVKRLFSHIQIWLSDSDGRQAALAEAIRLGADGLMAEDGPHRIAAPPAIERHPRNAPASSVPQDADGEPLPERLPNLAEPSADPLLTAEELRALLQETPGNSGV